MNFALLNEQIGKLRKQINETFKPDLVDDDKAADKELRDIVTAEHLKAFREMREEMAA